MSSTMSGPARPERLTPRPPSDSGRPDVAERTYGRLIGALFLAGFLTYGIGFALVSSVTGDRDLLAAVAAGQTTLMLGAFLMLLTIAVDIGKAVLFFPLLARFDRRVAVTYLAAMVFEVTMMAVGALLLLSLVPMAEQRQAGDLGADLAGSLGALALDGNDIAYQIAQAGLAFGAFFLCALLYRTRLVPRWLAAWGAVGYVIHFAGASAEILGSGVSMILLIPGGLFELTFGVWLLVKGLGAEPPGPRRVASSPSAA
jgi:hypothetical protein